MNKQTKVWLVLSIALSMLVLAAACGGAKSPDTNTPAAGETAATAYNGPTGTVDLRFTPSSMRFDNLYRE